MSKRVAIIGTGPCGLGQLSAFAAAAADGQDVPKVVAYERQSNWGGLWNYTWRTGTGARGEPVHSSMYRYLWSNGPKECLEFADYSFEEHFGKAIPSFPPREVLADYIRTRAEKTGMREYVRFNTEVRRVGWNPSTRNFFVAADNLVDGTSSLEEFDNVIVATGHFSVPNVPEFDGVDQFPGRVLHAHDFRDAAEFAGQDILIVGASYSAEDIGLQCHKYGARSVTMSYRTAAMGFKWPESMEERPLLLGFEGGTAKFSDGTTKDVDALILCTGYLHHFPFLPEDLRLTTSNRLCPPGLYKGVVFEANPAIFYLGMQDQYYTFTMFDAQAWFVRDIIMGRIAVPSAEEMTRDIDAWIAREGKLEDPLQEIDFQADYMRDLLKDVDYPSFDLDLTVEEFKEWEHHKEENILTYRDKCFRSPCTGNMAPLHGEPWLKAMDDSLEGYVG